MATLGTIATGYVFSNCQNNDFKTVSYPFIFSFSPPHKPKLLINVYTASNQTTRDYIPVGSQTKYGDYPHVWGFQFLLTSACRIGFRRAQPNCYSAMAVKVFD